MDRKTVREMVSGATNLRGLLDALRAVQDALTEEDPHNRNLFVRVGELIDVTDLPTYGGEEPDDTTGVWSWDATSLLVGEGSWAECRIVDRPQAVTVEMDSPVGPRVIWWGDEDLAELDSYLPDGWRVDTETQHVRTDTGGWSAPLCRDEDEE